MKKSTSEFASSIFMCIVIALMNLDKLPVNSLLLIGGNAVIRLALSRFIPPELIDNIRKKG